VRSLQVTLLVKKVEVEKMSLFDLPLWKMPKKMLIYVKNKIVSFFTKTEKEDV
jgi:hypothetical protein